MSEELKKISQLQYREAFVQVNYQKGFRYIDRAGELVNLFHDKDGTPPKFQMDLSGLLIREHSSVITDIRISPDHCWLHFVRPGSFDEVVDKAETIITKVIGILEPEKISRVGLRSYLVKETGHVEALLNKRSFRDYISFEEGVYKFQDNGTDFKLRLRADGVKGVMFDIDCYQNFPLPLPTNKNPKELKRLRERMNAPKILEVINAAMS